jgi:hypothetical protein
VEIIKSRSRVFLETVKRISSRNKQWTIHRACAHTQFNFHDTVLTALSLNSVLCKHCALPTYVSPCVSLTVCVCGLWLLYQQSIPALLIALPAAEVRACQLPPPPPSISYFPLTNCAPYHAPPCCRLYYFYF